jgi:hypothetical protein
MPIKKISKALMVAAASLISITEGKLPFSRRESPDVAQIPEVPEAMNDVGIIQCFFRGPGGGYPLYNLDLPYGSNCSDFYDGPAALQCGVQYVDEIDMKPSYPTLFFFKNATTGVGDGQCDSGYLNTYGFPGPTWWCLRGAEQRHGCISPEPTPAPPPTPAPYVLPLWREVLEISSFPLCIILFYLAIRRDVRPRNDENIQDQNNAPLIAPAMGGMR